MEDVNELVQNINKKVEKLIRLHINQQLENEKLKTTLKEYLLTIENQKKKIEELKNSNSKLVISELVKQTEGKVDVKKRIDKMVREIDKCIGLLNK